MLRFGPHKGPVVIAALPLFEEANRTRTFMVSILRALSDLGTSAVLPDLPGTGESLVPTSTASLSVMRDAYADLVHHFQTLRCPCFSVGIRSAVLLDTRARPAGRWQFAPQSGPELLRELNKIRQIASIDHSPSHQTTTIAGNHISGQFLSDLSLAGPSDAATATASLRTVRLASDPKTADIHLDGAPLWRHPEPGNDPVLASRLAHDIAQWAAKCAAS